MERLRTRFPLTVSLQFDPAGGAERAGTTYSGRLAAARDDLDVCCGFFDHVRGRGPNDEERAALEGALDAVRLAEAAQ
jgi:exonuclease SbcD